jgi:hypothetical protein
MCYLIKNYGNETIIRGLLVVWISFFFLLPCCCKIIREASHANDLLKLKPLIEEDDDFLIIGSFECVPDEKGGLTEGFLFSAHKL